MPQNLVWIAQCFDRTEPDAPKLRTQTRPAHLAYMAGIIEQIALAGPMTSDDGSAVFGSIIGYRTDTREQAEALMAQDPYVAAGLWSEVRWTRCPIAAGTLAQALDEA